LKLPQLLSQYLYQTRKLDLPGIGSFTLDTDAVIPQESDRVGQVAAAGIRFRNAVIAAPDVHLINFIKEHTGKMKSLAASDLDFYLTTSRQLLNIGKAFQIEGIGTLIKNKEGGFDFTPGDYIAARLDEAGPERRGGSDEQPRDREPQGNGAKQGLLLVLIVVGLVVVGWGGYYLYKRNSFSDAAEKRAVVVPDTPAMQATDTARLANRPTDSSAAAKPGTAPAGTAAVETAAAKPGAAAAKPGAAAAKPGTAGVGTAAPATAVPATGSPVTAAGDLPVPPGAELYRFVILSTDNKHRALRRYNQLLGYQLNIKMDQKDSSWFKLYFPIPARPKDTTYIKDSLSETYAAPTVIIEH
jgi:hypothetical protein